MVLFLTNIIIVGSSGEQPSDEVAADDLEAEHSSRGPVS